MCSISDDSYDWQQKDLGDLLTIHERQGKAGLELAKGRFVGLINQSTLKVEYEQYHLIFGTMSDHDPKLAFTDDEMQLLVGNNWKREKEHYLTRQRRQDQVVGRGFQSTLSDIPSKFCLSHFNILSQGKRVLVQGFKGDRLTEIPPIVNLAISLSETACHSGSKRGMYVWQRKNRASPQDSSSWHTVADLLFFDYGWQERTSETFLHASYEAKRDFLNADTRLARHDVVLPISVDFSGTDQPDPFEAHVNVDLDGEHPPVAAISIPGAGFIGWVRDMMPDRTAADFLDSCVRSSFAGVQYRLENAERAKYMVDDLAEMHSRALAMYNHPIRGAICFYDSVLRVFSDVERAEKSVHEVDE